ncbi:zinc-dependent peptidase [Abyssalbus ytuae]|uniref:Zinc-dependent peptidase n=1 Tax=Abyssalbus ytuae TaxID=2926907 RepID=A0A9E6ZX71_9FLAO|nr:zinc-dependent peptidase [Abyssalbus ytuae]UOB16807.1 zinc-dependent peptidase [Abyssalbus ytuae]
MYISFSAFIIKGLEITYVYFFKKPVYVHFYPFKKKLTHTQINILQNNIDFYRNLDTVNKNFFNHRVAAFINTYHFIGREGLTVTEEMKIILAGTYVMITFGIRNYLIDTLDKIIIYPKEYYSLLNKNYHKGEYNVGLKTVVLSWEDVKKGIEKKEDNLNLAIHEFTHALNIHGLKSRDHSAVIFYDTYLEILKYIEKPDIENKLNESNFFREYAKTNRLEFFAVILEHFFESPESFQKEFPQLYNLVKKMLNFNYIGY